MKGNFIENYITYAQKMTDAPAFFHEAMAWMCVSTVVHRKVYLDTGFRTYPNLWLVLLAPSSRFRKSTSLSIAESILDRIGRPCNSNDHVVGVPCTDIHRYVYPNDFSKEQLFSMLARQPSGLFLYSEVASLISTLNSNYNMGTMSLLTDLFDCPHIRERELRAEKFTIKDAYLNIGSASTIDWLSAVAKEEHFRGGFLSRFLYVVCQTKEEDRSPFDNAEPDIQATNQLVSQLRGIAQLAASGAKMEATKNAIKTYDEHYFGTKMAKIGNLLTPLLERHNVYILKLSILFALNRNSLTVEVEDVTRAIDNVTECLSKLSDAFHTDFAFNPHQKDMIKITGILRSEGKRLMRSDLLYRSHMSKTYFDRTIETLIENGSVDKVQEKNAKNGKMTVFYKLNGREK